MAYLLFGFIALFFSPVAGFAAEVMFEGYYRVDLNGKHIGYAIQRHEFEPKDKSFQTISFLRLKIGEEVIQESLKAKSNDKFQPISYSSTLQNASGVKAIDASFKGDIMKLKITDGKKMRDETHKLTVKGTFLSSFLTYLMLQKKLELNQAFQYSAVAEEDGGAYNGKALIESKETKKEYDIYRIVNSFKGDQFISRVAVVKDPKDPSKNVRGEILGTTSPDKNLSTALVQTPNLATDGHTVPNKTLVTLFGAMPTGKANLLAKEP